MSYLQHFGRWAMRTGPASLFCLAGSLALAGLLLLPGNSPVKQFLGHSGWILVLGLVGAGRGVATRPYFHFRLSRILGCLTVYFGLVAGEALNAGISAPWLGKRFTQVMSLPAGRVTATLVLAIAGIGIGLPLWGGRKWPDLLEEWGERIEGAGSLALRLLARRPQEIGPGSHSGASTILPQPCEESSDHFQASRENRASLDLPSSEAWRHSNPSPATTRKVEGRARDASPAEQVAADRAWILKNLEHRYQSRATKLASPADVKAAESGAVMMDVGEIQQRLRKIHGGRIPGDARRRAHHEIAPSRTIHIPPVVPARPAPIRAHPGSPGNRPVPAAVRPFSNPPASRPNQTILPTAAVRPVPSAAREPVSPNASSPVVIEDPVIATVTAQPASVSPDKRLLKLADPVLPEEGLVAEPALPAPTLPASDLEAAASAVNNNAPALPPEEGPCLECDPEIDEIANLEALAPSDLPRAPAIYPVEEVAPVATPMESVENPPRTVEGKPEVQDATASSVQGVPILSVETEHEASNSAILSEPVTPDLLQRGQPPEYPPDPSRWEDYAPPLNLLQPPSASQEPVNRDDLARQGRLIEEKLAEFKVKVVVQEASAGPVITRYEVEPAVGVRGSQVVNLMKDLARALGVTAIRVVETIPGKTYMGLELPNLHRQMIRLSEVLSSEVFRNHGSKLAMALGKDIIGNPVVADLAKAPHMLVAGTTGSGKSVGVNAMILSLLYRASPEEVRFVMIDPKMLELSVYDGIPHLLAPVVTDMKLAANALHWCVTEMERRYRLMSALGVRNLAGYNQKVIQAREAGRPLFDPFSVVPESPAPLEPLPFIVVVVDEFADLMMVAGKRIEELIARLAQKARAAGIHLILATQRPSVDVITGLIKANIPTRIAFQVSSKVDSRTILDQMGAETLLGQGDMLYLPPGTGYPQRVHGAFVADEEVHALAEHLKQYGEPDYVEAVLGGAPEGDLFGDTERTVEETDPLYDQAVAIVINSRRASISLIQRNLRIGYNRAARLVEQMEMAGVVSPMESNGSRTVLVPAS